MWMWFLPTGQTPTLPWRVSDRWPDPRDRGLVEAWGRDNACCSVTWEGEKYWQGCCPHRTGDLCFWPKGCLCGHTRTHISSNLTILPHLSSSILVYHSLSLFSSVSVGSLVSTGSLSCTRSQPSLFFGSRIICPPPPGGSWYIFGLVSLDTSPTVRSVPSTL